MSESGDSKLKTKNESDVEEKVISQNIEKQANEVENLGLLKQKETSEKSENLTQEKNESNRSKASEFSAASNIVEPGQKQNDNNSTEPHTSHKQSSVPTNNNSQTVEEENVTNSETVNENKMKAESDNEVKADGEEIRTDLVKETNENDVVVEQNNTKALSIASSDESSTLSTSYTSTISTTTDSSLKSNRTDITAHEPKKSETEPKIADKYNKKTGNSKELENTSNIESSKKDSEIQKFAKSLVDSIINSKESFTSSNGESLSSSLTRVSTVENSNIKEPKKTDTYGTNDGKNTVAHNKVSSFWTHMSENQKEAIKKNLERKLFYQNNPSAKEADENQKEAIKKNLERRVFYQNNPSAKEADENKKEAIKKNLER